MKQVTISAMQSHGYDCHAMRKVIRSLIESLPHPLSPLVKRGDRVLIKPHLQHGSVRDPATRLVSHPVFIECIVEAFVDLGTHVLIGDEGSHTVSAYAGRYHQHRLHNIVKRTGAELVNFAVEGASAVRSGLSYPYYHWITNVALGANFVVNCGNAQTHPRLVFSGAVKNMMNVLVGDTQNRMYILFPRARDLARIVASVCMAVRPGLSFLDMTTVYMGGDEAILRPVGLVLASEDPVALDTLAAQILGYGNRRIWTSHYGQKLGLGCASLSGMAITGCNIEHDAAPDITEFDADDSLREGPYEKLTRFANATMLRPRPTIVSARCIGCGHCSLMCPTGAIMPTDQGKFVIDLKSCIDCGRCATTCETAAVELQHNLVSRTIRRLLRK